MIISKNNVLNKTKDWNKDNIHILMDFDFTITDKTSPTSWGILGKSNLVPKDYVTKRQNLYDYYSPIEIDETIDLEEKAIYMNEWWTKHLNLITSYKISEEIINKAASDPNVMTLRKGAKEFLELMHKNNIPVIIISAGIGNFIEKFLKINNCYYDNIEIISNFIKFENGLSKGLKKNIIHTLNKSEVEKNSSLTKERPNIILFGDNIGDIKMASETKEENLLKVGFLEEKIEENKKHYENAYDLVCINSDYLEIIDFIPTLKSIY